jgi:hypothetical protein
MAKTLFVRCNHQDCPAIKAIQKENDRFLKNSERTIALFVREYFLIVVVTPE